VQVCRKNVITSETAVFYGLKKFPTYLEGTNSENFTRKMEMLERDHFSTSRRVGLCVSLKFPFQGNRTDEFGDLNLSSSYLVH